MHLPLNCNQIVLDLNGLLWYYITVPVRTDIKHFKRRLYRIKWE